MRWKRARFAGFHNNIGLVYRNSSSPPWYIVESQTSRVGWRDICSIISLIFYNNIFTLFLFVTKIIICQCLRFIAKFVLEILLVTNCYKIKLLSYVLTKLSFKLVYSAIFASIIA